MVMSFVQVRKILCLYYYYYIIVCRQNLAEICVKNFYNFFFTCTTNNQNKKKFFYYRYTTYMCVCARHLHLSLSNNVYPLYIDDTNHIISIQHPHH